MAADAELFQALLYLESHATALKDAQAQRTASVQRVRLWEYIREQADLHQARAIEQARASGVEWADLVSALAVNAPNAAYNKAKRLKAAALTDASHEGRHVRRTPEAVQEVERQVATRAAAERRAERQAARRHTLLAPVARRLIECRAGLDEDEDITFWLDQIAAVLPDCQTSTQLVSLETYVKAVVREVRHRERAKGKMAATADARSAVEAAAELVTS